MTNHRTLAGLLALTAVGAVACQSDPPSLPQGDEAVRLDPADFTTNIDNRYWPMDVGTRWTSRETDGEGHSFHVEVIVTDQTKTIANGIEARVVRDTVRDESGAIVEDTFDWFAQDQDGNLWYLGEDTAEYEDGEVSSTEGSWEAGVDGAQAGVALPAHPEAGMAYRQEFLADVAEDNGAVLSTAEMADTPAGHFDDLLLTKDTTPVEPDVLEYKLYAPGVGPVMTLDASGGAGREVLLDVDRVPG